MISMVTVGNNIDFDGTDGDEGVGNGVNIFLNDIPKNVCGHQKHCPDDGNDSSGEVIVVWIMVTISLKEKSLWTRGKYLK